MTEELKACPFCGGAARLDQRVTQSLWNSSDAVFSHVACDECDIHGQDFCDDPDGSEAIEWWNARAQLPSQGGEAVEVVAWQDAENPLYTTAERRVMHEWASNQYPIVELMTVSQHQRILAASVPAGCKVVPVELLSGVLEYCDQLLGELNHLYNYAGSTGDDIQHDDADYEQLRALLASAEGVKDE